MEDLTRVTNHKRPVGRPAYGDGLSPAEAKVFEPMLLGRSNDEIAHQLSLKVKTVKFHVRNILRKKNAGSRYKLLAQELQQVIAKRAVEAMGKLPSKDFCPVVLSRSVGA